MVYTVHVPSSWGGGAALSFGETALPFRGDGTSCWDSLTSFRVDYNTSDVFSFSCKELEELEKMRKFFSIFSPQVKLDIQS